MAGTCGNHGFLTAAGRATATGAFIWAAFMVCMPTAHASDDPAFNWSVTPYLWASQTQADLSFRDEALGGDTISFRDLLDQLDSAFMIHVETGRNRWSVFTDLTYLETSDSDQRPIFRVDTDAETTVADVGLTYWPGGVGAGVGVFGGLRYSGFDNRYRFYRNDAQVGEARDDDDYYDALLGLRYRFDLAERWEMLAHADYSFGQSEGTWLVRAQLARTVGKRALNRIVFGYQYKRADFVFGDLRTRYTYHGPNIGFNFRF